MSNHAHPPAFPAGPSHDQYQAQAAAEAARAAREAEWQYVPPRAYQPSPVWWPPGPVPPPAETRRWFISDITEKPTTGHPPLETDRIDARISSSTGPNPYGQLLKDKPAHNAMPPMGIDIGIIEILTFFPSWLQNPDVIVRAYRNGWRRNDIAKAQLHAMGALTKANLTRTSDRIQKQISEGGKRVLNLNDNERWDSSNLDDLDEEDDLTATLWQLRREYPLGEGQPPNWGHMELAKAANGVVNWPVGEDRLLMTTCIEFARARPHLKLDTSHYHYIVQTQGHAYPQPMDRTHDQAALTRLRATVPDPP